MAEPALREAAERSCEDSSDLATSGSGTNIVDILEKFCVTGNTRS